MDLDDQQYLLKKLWCHGQLFAPIQGVMILVWSFKEPLEGGEFNFCLIAPLLLGCWSLMSWRSMNKFWPPPPVLIRAGLCLQCYYVGIIYVCGRHARTSTFSLMVLMFTCLQVMETGAYLTMVGCLKDSLSVTQSQPLPLQDRGLHLDDLDLDRDTYGNSRDGVERQSFI